MSIPELGFVSILNTNLKPNLNSKPKLPIELIWSELTFGKCLQSTVSKLKSALRELHMEGHTANCSLCIISSSKAIHQFL